MSDNPYTMENLQKAARWHMDTIYDLAPRRGRWAIIRNRHPRIRWGWSCTYGGEWRLNFVGPIIIAYRREP